MKHRRRVRRFGRRDNGFTLIELVIAMVVLAIVAAVVMPSFLGSRNNSYDKEAQASIEIVLRAASALYSSQGDFSNAGSAGCGTDAGAGPNLAADLQKLQPNVDVVGGSVTSTNSRVVSVDARPTFNSNGEKLGCQAFYATVFSSSGSCFVARLTFEGKFLAASSVSPVVVSGQTNTSNSAVITWSAQAVNGHAFGVLRPQSNAADGDDSNSMASIQTACMARTQSTGAAALSTNYIAPSQFYESWRDAVAAPVQPPPTCAQGGVCEVGNTGPGGGTVFYVRAGGGTFTSTGSDCGTSCKYFEAAPSDQSQDIAWATTAAFCFANASDSGTSNCQTNSIYSNSDGQAAKRTAAEPIGMGMANTIQIHSRLTTAGGAATNTYAAGLAFAFTNNGKTDWHLPSRDELNQMAKWQRGVAWTSDATLCTGGTLNSGPGASGFHENRLYQSSSEVTADTVRHQAFNFCQNDNTNFKSANTLAMRAVRAFGPTS